MRRLFEVLSNPLISSHINIPMSATMITNVSDRNLKVGQRENASMSQKFY